MGRLRGMAFRSLMGARRLVGHDPIASTLARWHRREGPRTFMQIGSNDGVTNDPLWRLIHLFGWSGFALEPVPWVFDRLQANHLDVDVTCLNVAVGTDVGTAQIFAVQGRHRDDPPWADQISSFDRNHVMGHAGAVPDLEARISAIEVKVTTVPALWVELGKPRIDLLHLDVEGVDAQVLMTVPYDEMEIRAVLYEYVHMDPSQRARVEALHNRLGFRTKARTALDRLVMRPHSAPQTWLPSRGSGLPLPLISAFPTKGDA